MADLDRAVANQLANIEKRAGRSLAEFMKIVNASGLSKHGELVAMLKTTLGMGHGDANLIVHTVRRADEAIPSTAEPVPAGQLLDQLYVGPKATLRPIHERLLAAMDSFGAFDSAPKKTYVSYRRKKQFAMIGPATTTRVEVGLNVKGLKSTDRLIELPPKQMCNYKVRLGDVGEVDQEVVGWLGQAYGAAG